MASVFGHGILAFTLSRVLDKKHLKLLTFLAIVSAIIPDADVLAFNFGIPYGHMFGHRGFTHSIVFAVFWATILTLIFSKGQKTIYFTVLFLSTLSHGVLDAMTTGGKGVGFFIPFNSERYFLPFRKIQVSPLSVGEFFSEWGKLVIFSELKYIVLPCVIVLVILYILKKV